MVYFNQFCIVYFILRANLFLIKHKPVFDKPNRYSTDQKSMISVTNHHLSSNVPSPINNTANYDASQFTDNVYILLLTFRENIYLQKLPCFHNK